MELNKETVVQAVITKINKNNRKTIRTKYLKNFEEPEKVNDQKGLHNYVPDISVEYKGSLILFEIELNNKFNIHKWKSISEYLAPNNGKLTLVFPERMLYPVMYNIKKHNLKNIIAIPFQIKNTGVDSK